MAILANAMNSLEKVIDFFAGKVGKQLTPRDGNCGLEEAEWVELFRLVGLEVGRVGETTHVIVHPTL
jgi:hypothetical protein